MKNISNIDNKMNEKKKRTAIIVCLLVLMICITGSTYAYFALTASNNSTVTGSVGASSSLTLTVNKIYPSNSTGKMIPQLENALSQAISSEYNCIDDNNNVICHVYEVKIKNANIAASLTGKIYFSTNGSMPNLKWKLLDFDTSTGRPIVGDYQTNSAIYYHTKIFVNNDYFNANEEKKYYFVVWINETQNVQTDNGTYKATISFESVGGGLSSDVVPVVNDNGALYIEKLYNKEGSELVTTNISSNSSKPQLTQNKTQSILLDNNGEYRYYGANPNNYIKFNGELWRIISSSTVKSSSSDTTGSKRLKIIKDTSIGEYAWNIGGTNNWADATLMCQLNTMYYNDTIQACTEKSLASLEVSLNTEASSLIDNALWYLGQSDEPDAYSFTQYYANDFYNSERSSNVIEGNPANWTGKVGLIYVSDAGYATDHSICDKNMYEYRLNSECYNNNWLAVGGNVKWTIHSSQYRPGTTFAIATRFPDGYGANKSYIVFPVVYLNSNVMITTGNGTKASPYTLSLPE